MKGFIFATGVLLSAGVCAAAPVNWAGTIVTPGVAANGWNGKFNGQDVALGVYVYYAEIEFIDGFTEVFKGDIAVIR